MTVWITWVTWTQQHLQATGTPSSGQSVSSTQTLHSAFILCLTLGASDGKHSHLDHFRHACILIDNPHFSEVFQNHWLTDFSQDFYPRLLDFSYRFIIISFTSSVENIHFSAYPIAPNVYEQHSLQLKYYLVCSDYSLFFSHDLNFLVLVIQEPATKMILAVYSLLYSFMFECIRFSYISW